MGSGRGKTRRVKVVSVKNSSLRGVTIAENSHKIHEWAQAQGIQNVGLLDYYLGKNRGKYGDAEKEFVLREFFLDAVNSGIFVFGGPKKIDPENFTFKLKQGNQRYRGLELVVEYAPLGEPKITGNSTFFNAYYLEGNRKISSMSDAVYYLRNAIQNTVREASA